MGVFRDLTGATFGRLTVVQRVGSDIHKNALWKCICQCGNTCVVPGTKLLKGSTKSCGCYRAEILATSHTKYPDAVTKYLAIRKFGSMKQRCFNPNDRSYSRYGGRGITICNEWLKNPQLFADWAIANGWQKDLSIDRKEVNGNYCPKNCRWADDYTQANNKRSSHFITIGGVTKTLKQWSDELHLTYANLINKPSEYVLNTIMDKLAQK